MRVFDLAYKLKLRISTCNVAGKPAMTYVLESSRCVAIGRVYDYESTRCTEEVGEIYIVNLLL
jgi:hypothetical protein